VTHAIHGEDDLLVATFEQIAPASRYAVEIGGAYTHRHSNIRQLIEAGWAGLQIDGDPQEEGVAREWVTPGNCCEILRRHGVPARPGAVSIDIDGNDWWVWRALGAEFSPDAVVVEYNCNFAPLDYAVMEPDDARNWSADPNATYGASFVAFLALGEALGYYLYAEAGYSSLVFVKNQHRQRLPPVFRRNQCQFPHELHEQRLTRRFLGPSEARPTPPPPPPPPFTPTPPQTPTPEDSHRG